MEKLKRLKTIFILVILSLFAGIVLAEDKEPQVGISYGEHGFEFATEDGKDSLAIGSRLQFRYTFDDYDRKTGKDDISSFQVKRAKIFAHGNAFTKDLTYKIQVNAAGSSVTLDDFYGNYKLLKWLQIRCGQYKVPFNRQELTSSGSQQFVDRAITNEAFTLSRDQGVMLHSFLLNDYAEYAIGVFNGNGRNKSTNENNGHLFAGRIAFYPLGKFKMYSESDIGHTTSPKAGIGVAGAYNARVPFKEGDETFIKDVTSFAADAIIKWYGVSFAGDYFITTTNVRGGEKTNSNGFNVQAGVFLIPEHLELAGRFAMVDPDVNLNDDTEQEIAGSINYFINKHKLKLQADYAILIEEQPGDDPTLKENRFRLQFQAIF